MNQSGNKDHEKWRKAFRNASETPPPDIWDAIEKHLDSAERKPTPVLPWWKNRAAWAAAASLLLALTIGMTLYLQNDPSRPSVITQMPEIPAQADAPETLPPAATSTTSALTEGAVAHTATENKGTSGIAVSGREALSPVRTAQSIAKKEVSVTATPAGTAPDAYSVSATRSQETTDVTSSENAQPVIASAGELSSPELLAPRHYRESEVFFQKRYVFYHKQLPEPDPEEMKAALKKSDYWAGLSLMPASFNPNIKFNTASVYGASPSQNYATNNSVGTNRADQHNKPGLSYSVSTQAGMKLNKHWSIETGLTYLQGNASYNSGGFFMDVATNRSADLLANAMLSGKSNYSSDAADKVMLGSEVKSLAPVYVAMDKAVENNYRYLQVPAYLGYTINPSKKLHYTLLGGGVANLFLKNELGTASGYTLTTTPKNQVYNTVSWAAGAGLRVGYKVSDQWVTSLTGTYQQSLMTAFKDNNFLEAYPQLYGISWGVRYSF